MFPTAIAVPSTIKSYQDISDFLKQFSPVPSDHPAIKYFGLSSEWAEQHKPELFGFLLGFLVGDAGKNYPEYERRSRRPIKTTLSTNMATNPSNTRLLRYVQLCLAVIGIGSHQQLSQTSVIRWVSPSSSLLTWIIRVCLGLATNQRTGRNPISMDWILDCPHHFIVSFIQGVSESDGSVSKHGYYTAIASVPNSDFYKTLLAKIGTHSRTHPKHHPTQLRINLLPALQLPLFNPIINSYRYQNLILHAKLRTLLPPSSSFFWKGEEMKPSRPVGP